MGYVVNHSELVDCWILVAGDSDYFVVVVVVVVASCFVAGVGVAVIAARSRFSVAKYYCLDLVELVPSGSSCCGLE